MQLHKATLSNTGNNTTHVDPADVTVVVPAYNEASRILGVLDTIKKSGFHKIIVVDDGSTDNTAEIAERCEAQVVQHNINRGPGAATQTGLHAAKIMDTPYIITIDADGQHNPDNIPVLLAPLLSGDTDVVIGSRFLHDNTIPWTRRLFNTVANLLTFFLSGILLTDSQSGFKAFNRRAVENIRIITNGFEFCSEVVREIAHKGLRYAEVPADVVYTRESMKKGQNLAQGIKTAFKLFIRSLTR